MPVLADTRTAFALASASVRYRLTIAATVRTQLTQWRSQAERIEDRRLRAMAVSKLDEEGFNAAAAAMLATLPTPSRRVAVARAIVALEVLFDYLDGRTELPADRDPLDQRRELMDPLVRAIVGSATEPRANQPGEADATYVLELARAVDRELTALHVSASSRARMLVAGERSIEAQTRLHAVGELGSDQLEQWARATTNGSGLGWREYLAGSGASVLAIHALIATSEDDAEGAAVDEAYLYIGALATLLDGVVDQRKDARLRAASYADLFGSRTELQGTLAALTRGAADRTLALRRGAAHRMVLGGVLAYYTTAPGAGGELAKATIATLQASHRGLIEPAALVLRAWRWGRGDGR